MTTTQAQAEVMTRTAARFEQVNESLQAMLTRLMGELEVLRTQWQGAGGRSFDRVTQQWREDQEALQQALLQTAEAIRQSGDHYRSADDAASRRLARAGGGRLELPL